MEVDADVRVISQTRVPDSRLPDGAVDVQKTLDDDVVSVWALWPLFALALLAITGAALTFSYGAQRTIQLMLQCIMPAEPEPWHILALAGVIVVVITSCIPLVLLLFPLPSLIFGFWPGFVTLFMINVIAALISFCIGRYIAQWRVRRFFESRQYGRTMRLFRILEKEEESMHLLILFRFLLIPLAARNYAPSILAVPIPTLMLSTIPHSVFSSIVFAMMGTALHEPAQNLRDGKKFVFRTPHWQQVTGMVVAVSSFALFTWIGYRAYARKVEEETEGGTTAAALHVKGDQEHPSSTHYGTGFVLSMQTSVL